MLVDRLKELCHWNGRPVCRIYGWGACPRSAVVGQGPTVALNLMRADGSVVGHRWVHPPLPRLRCQPRRDCPRPPHAVRRREVETVARLHGILLRGGCFCNPGACAAHLGLSSQDLQARPCLPRRREGGREAVLS